MSAVAPGPTKAMIDADPGVDLTPVWQRCHAHLVPDEKHLKLPRSQYLPCTACGGDKAFDIAAHLRFGPDIWVEQSRLRHCPDCRRFMLPLSLRQDCEARVPAAVGLPVTAVDARLWSAAPTFLNIEPTTRCNFSCWYCIGRHMVQADIEVDNFARVLDNFPSLKAIALVGEGEPLLHKGFFTMADMARERGIRVLMLSNGSAFSESVVRKLCESQIAYVSVSIDSVDPATFAQSRIDGDLARIWEGIEKLRRYRDSNGYLYPKIGLKGTLFTHTEDQLIEIAAEAKRHGVDLLESFQPLNPKTSYVNIYPAAARAELDQVERVARRIDEQTAQARSLLPSAVDFCAAEGVPASNVGRSNGMRAGCDEEWIYSLLDGHVTPCCQVKDVLDPAWNLFEHSMQDILANARYQNMRFNLWNGLFPAYCRGCSKTRPWA
ncbi:MAG: radical SAM protein [Rubrivivax sp.]|nr:radical SAM protein [Rubrivivax sp.]